MVRCSEDNSYYSTPEFLVVALRIVSLVCMPLHALGYCCIMYKTPKTMSSVKWNIFLLHSCCFIFDVLTTIFAVPYAIFPAMAGYGLGVIDSPGLYLYLIVTLITATSTTVFYFLETRYFMLYAEDSWWKYVRKPVVIVSYIMVPIYFLPAQCMIPEQESARKQVWESLGCQPELPKDRELFVLSTDYVAIAWHIITAELVPFFEIGIFMSLHSLKLMIKPSSKLSPQTVKLQQKLNGAIIIQSYTDILLFGIPVNVAIWCIKSWYHSQAINNFVFITLSLHGSLCAILMILVYKPYRDFVLSPFARVLPKVSTIVVASSI